MGVQKARKGATVFGFRSKTFDIQASRKGRWTIEQTADDQASAEAAAKALFGKLKDIEAVRVVQDGKDDKVLFEQKKPEGKAPMVVPQIEEAPLCAHPDDLNGAQARKAMNKLFRPYLDKALLTPTEIMHNGREMKRILDFESIVQTAIARVAGVQKGPEGDDAKKRSDVLWKLSDAVSRRASEADKLKFPAIKEVGFDAAVKTVAASAKPEELKFMLRCLLSRELSQMRSWYGKLIQLLEWCNTAREAAGLSLLDDFISDTLASASLVTDIIGQQPNLASAVIKLIDVADGEYKPSKTQSAEMASMEELLCKLLKAGRLPASREFLLERVASELRSQSPLSKRDAEGEFERYDEVLGRVLLPTGVAGGTEMAEALVQRAANYLKVGGAPGHRDAVAWMMLRGPSPLASAHLLLVLMRSRLAAGLETVPTSQLKTLFGEVADVARLVARPGNPMSHMRGVTSLHRAIAKSAELSPDVAGAVKSRLDDLLYDYVVKGKIIEQMDNPERKLHMRAFLLMKMCMPDVLPDGKAIAVAREAVVTHLRRPNFEVELVAGIADPAEQKKIILQCHQMMKAGGFR